MAPHEIKIMLWNAQSILSTGTYGEFQKTVEDTNPDIICLVETWLNDSRKISLKGYNLFRKDRDCNGGGIAIFSRLELEAKVLEINDYNNGIYEFLGISISFNNAPLNIIGQF